LLCQIYPTSGSKPGTPFEYELLPDTGATITIISFDVARRYSLRLRASNEKLLTADESKMKVAGCTRIKINGVQIKALVTDAIEDEILLCWRDMIRLSIIPENFPTPQAHMALKVEISQENAEQLKAEDAEIKKRTEELFTEFADVISDSLPEEPMKGPPMTIKLKDDPNMKPRCATTCKPIPFHMEEAAERCITQLVKDGIIEKVPVDEVCEWINYIFATHWQI